MDTISVFKALRELSKLPIWTKLPDILVYVLVVVQALSCVWLFVTPLTTKCQVPLSPTNSWHVCVLSGFTHVHSLRHYGLYPVRLLCLWGFSRQEYWSWLPCPPPGDLLNPGIEPVLLMSPTLAGQSFPWVPPRKPYCLLEFAQTHVHWVDDAN